MLPHGVETRHLIFPLISLGRLLGAMVNVFCPGTSGRAVVLLGASGFVAAVLCGLISLTTNAVLMFASFAAQGFFHGFLDGGLTRISSRLRASKAGRYLLLDMKASLTLLYSLSATVALTFVEGSKSWQRVEPNQTEIISAESNQTEIISRWETNDQTFVLNFTYFQFLYPLIVVIVFVSSLVFMLTFIFTESQNESLKAASAATEKTGLVVPPALTPLSAQSWDRAVTAALFCVISFLFMGTWWNVNSFLPKLAVVSLGKPREAGAVIGVVFGISILIGSFLSAVSARICSPKKLLTAALIAITIDFIALSIGGARYEVVLIVCVVIYGWCAPTIYGQLFALLDQCVRLTHLESNLMIGTQCMGEFVMTLVTARFYATETMAFMYMSTIFILWTDLTLFAILKMSKTTK